MTRPRSVRLIDRHTTKGRICVAVLVSLVLWIFGCTTSDAPARDEAGNDVVDLLIAQSEDLGPSPTAEQVWLVLGLRTPAGRGQSADLAAMYDPASPTFGHFYSAAEYASRYGAASDDVSIVEHRLRAGGLEANWSPGDSWVTVTGPADSVDRFFNVRIHDYISPDGVRYYASRLDTAMPSSLGSQVISNSPINSYVPLAVNAIPGDGLSPTDLIAAYDLAPLRNLGFRGRDETVVFIEPGTESYRQSDLDTFTTRFGLAPIQVEDRGAPSGHIKGNVETEMDLEAVHEIAPEAKLVVYNAPGNLQAMFDVQARVVAENPGAIISQSWGVCEPFWGGSIKVNPNPNVLAATEVASALGEIYDKADMMGETVFVSSGDSGAYECLRLGAPQGTPPDDSFLGGPLPCTAPGVTCVGGTHIGLRSDGSYLYETVWEQPAETAGTGGGVSKFYPTPVWQVGPGVTNSFSTGKREFPDISSDADPYSGVAICVPRRSGDCWTLGGGTSLSAPILAGISAVLNQFLKQQGLRGIGFANPALYALAAKPGLYPPFHDVVVGTNLYYPATPGYDLATGLGTPDAWNLARDLFEYQRRPS